MKYFQCAQNDNQGVSIQKTIHAIKKSGFDGVFIQWFNKDWEFSQQEQLNLCRELGLEICFAHLGYEGINNIWIEGEEGDKLVDNYLKDLDACKMNNIDLVIIHLVSKFVAPSPSLVGIKRLQKIVDYAEKLNINVAFENTKIQGYLEYVIKHIKNSNAGICFDAGHCHCFFDDKFDWEFFKDKIFAIHLHDNDKSSDMHLLPFDGSMDWKLLKENLQKANYSGPIVLESRYSNDYKNLSLQEFYNLSFERAKQLNQEK